MLMPETLSSSVSGATVIYRLRVPPALEHFQGHFPVFRSCPAIVQLDWAVRSAACTSPASGKHGRRQLQWRRWFSPRRS
jgi:3-hydroxymyristoyl/3-hydroxydecanoyl-(acyl carrier protein) dehydratase